MPAKTNPLSKKLKAELEALGEQVRTQRKALRISATAAAEAADMSRVTWHRIESGEASVTMGAYVNAMAALGLGLGVVEPHANVPAFDKRQWIPVRVRLSDYPALKRLAWQVHGTDELTPSEALGVYERNARHLDTDAMLPHEADLLEALRAALGDDGPRDV
jgi:transcriptional regulator with XRE-family HTH domain